MNIIEFALLMEAEATEFYKSLARKVPEKGPQRIFLDLASDHVERQRFIEKVCAAWEKSSGLERPNLTEGTSPWHGLPSDPRMLADFDDTEAYRLALKLEEEEIRCYEDLLERILNGTAKKILRQIAEEEKRHLEEYRELYDFINAPNQYLAWGEFSNLEEFHQFGRDVD